MEEYTLIVVIYINDIHEVATIRSHWKCLWVNIGMYVLFNTVKTVERILEIVMNGFVRSGCLVLKTSLDQLFICN